jgi:hypothetical protein
MRVADLERQGDRAEGDEERQKKNKERERRCKSNVKRNWENEGGQTASQEGEGLMSSLYVGHSLEWTAIQ